MKDRGDQPVPRWEHFEHGADIGVRGLGRSLDQAFEQVALALTAAVADPDRITPRETRTLTCDAPDTELLLVDWLNRLIYELTVEGMIFSTYGVETDGRNLTATCRGERLDRLRHQPAVEPKGATQTALRVDTIDGIWIAQCVVDV